MKRYFEGEGKASWRRRFAPALLVLGLLGASKLTYDAAPREQPVHVHLPDQVRANLQGARLTYLEDGVEVSGSEQRFQDGAPAILHSAPSLSPGHYQLQIELSERNGAVRRLQHELIVPTEGAIRIRFSE